MANENRKFRVDEKATVNKYLNINRMVFKNEVLPEKVPTTKESI